MPLSNEQLAELSKPMRNLKIICGALIAGVCFMGVVLAALLDFANLHTELTMLVSLAAMSGAIMYSMSFIVFKVLSKQTHSKSESPQSHLNVLQAAWIVRFAMIEGACFMNLIVSLLENSLITLFVALVGILFMLLGFPRSTTVEELIDEKLKS